MSHALTHVTACDYGNDKADFKAVSVNLQKILKHFVMLRPASDELHTELKRCKINWTFVENIGWSDSVAS